VYLKIIYYSAALCGFFAQLCGKKGLTAKNADARGFLFHADCADFIRRFTQIVAFCGISVKSFICGISVKSFICAISVNPFICAISVKSFICAICVKSLSAASA
jgi:hypothetical protein